MEKKNSKTFTEIEMMRSLGSAADWGGGVPFGSWPAGLMSWTPTTNAFSALFECHRIF